jgi:hypothetical protein
MIVKPQVNREKLKQKLPYSAVIREISPDFKCVNGIVSEKITIAGSYTQNYTTQKSDCEVTSKITV